MKNSVLSVVKACNCMDYSIHKLEQEERESWMAG